MALYNGLMVVCQYNPFEILKGDLLHNVED
jgi:hypothetical protein